MDGMGFSDSVFSTQQSVFGTVLELLHIPSLVVVSLCERQESGIYFVPMVGKADAIRTVRQLTMDAYRECNYACVPAGT